MLLSAQQHFGSGEPNMTTEPSETSSPLQALSDRVAIVTGAGRGIGRGIARCLARAGAAVAMVDQAEDRIAAGGSEGGSLGGRGGGLCAGGGRGGGVWRAVRGTIERVGKIGILGGNAR